MRKVILYIATSLDGFIAKHDEDLSFLSRVEKKGEDYGYAEFVKTVDTVIIGRKTYDWVMQHVKKFPHSETETFIITRTPKSNIGKAKFYTGNIKELISQLKLLKGKNIFIDGGAEIVNELLKDKLIDQFCISIIPVLLGTGIRLFKDGLSEQNLKLIDIKQFDTGLVQLFYELSND